MPAALVARAGVASADIAPAVRPHAAPNYASDLGLRGRKDAREFLVGCLASLRVRAAVDDWREEADCAERWRHGRSNSAEVARVLDGLVSFCGDWPAAARLAHNVDTSTRPVNTYRALTYMAAAMSVSANDAAERLYERATQAVDAGPVDRAMASVRLAAWHIKRRGAPLRGLAVLADLDSKLEQDVVSDSLTNSDVLVLRGVRLNLQALVHSREGELGLAWTALEEAKDCLTASDLRLVGTDHRNRYAAQVTVNRAQLLTLRGDLVAALELLEQHVTWTRSHHIGSLSEALTLVAYLRLRNRDARGSVGAAREACRLIIEEGDPSRLEQARKIRIAAHAAAGETKEADRVLRALSEDRLGIDERLQSVS